MSYRLIVVAFALLAASFITRAADNEDYNPYKNVVVGDFATYKISMKFGPVSITGSSTQSITAKTDKEASVKVVSSVNGMDIPAEIKTIDLTKPYDPSKTSLPAGIDATVTKDKDGKEKLKLSGKDYDATWTSYTVKAKVMSSDIDAKIKVWMSKDIKMGVLKLEMSGDLGKDKMEMTMEVTDTGNKKQ